MSDEKQSTGRCLCGKVEISFSGGDGTYSVCHCEMCRRWASGPFFATHDISHIAFQGEEYIGRYQSSEWAERGFCKVCGSNLFYYLTGTEEYMIATGTLDDQAHLKMHIQVFIDEKPESYAFTNNTQKMTGEELFALYAPKD